MVVGGYVYGPQAIHGIPDAPIPGLAVIGDSLAGGAGDNGTDTVVNTAVRGTIERFFRNAGGNMNCSQSGELAFNWISSGGVGSAGRRSILALSFANTAIIWYGHNDFAGGQTAANVRTWVTTIVTQLRAMGITRIYVGTVVPKVVSATNNTPTTNWSGGAASQPAIYNAALRATPIANTTTVDFCGQVEATTGSGTYSDLVYTLDGQHLSPTGCLQALLAIPDSLKAI
jgi:lysophospholipase L1-like esterase